MEQYKKKDDIDSRKGFDLNKHALSRAVGLMGSKSTQILANEDISSFLIVGLRQLGFEIARNLVLLGAKKIFLYDPRPFPKDEVFPCPNWDKISKNDRSRAEFAADMLNQRHFLAYQEVVAVNEENFPSLKEKEEEEEGSDDILYSLFNNFKNIIFADWNGVTSNKMQEYNDIIRNKDKNFICCTTYGLLGAVFVDFGKKEFSYLREASTPLPKLIKNIQPGTHPRTNEPIGIVTTYGEEHNLKPGVELYIEGVNGMKEVNEMGSFKFIHIPQKHSQFGIPLDVSKCSTPYEEGGEIRILPRKGSVNFTSLQQSLNDYKNSTPSDRKKNGLSSLIGLISIIESFKNKYNHLPTTNNTDDVIELLNKVKELSLDDYYSERNIIELVLNQLEGELSPMCTIFGGIVAQEAIKGILNVSRPLVGWFTLDKLDCITPFSITPSYKISGDVFLKKTISKRIQGTIKNQMKVFDVNLQTRLSTLRIFLIGAGALGCEFLKCFSMMGIATDPPKEGEYSGDGVVTVTDLDKISFTNLHRQFLFREIDVKKGAGKAKIAKRAVKRINRDMIVDSLEIEASPKTKNLEFDDDFMESQHVYISAVDTNKARVFLNEEAHFYNKPFLNSGTLGLSCNTEVVMPFISVPYKSSTRRAANCSEKFELPYLPDHVLQNGRALMEEWFYKKLGTYRDVCLSKSKGKEYSSDHDATYRQYYHAFGDPFEEREEKGKGENMKKGKGYEKITSKTNEREKKGEEEEEEGSGWRIKAYNWALNKLTKMLNTNIIKYTTVHPQDEKSKNGILYWSGNRLFPTPLNIDTRDTVQDAFLRACVDLVKEARRNDLAPFEYDKDNKAHIDFVFNWALLQAYCYGIPPVKDYSTAQRIAGEITPAIITTTAVAVGMTCLELYKVAVSDHRMFSSYKNSKYSSGAPTNKSQFSIYNCNPRGSVKPCILPSNFLEIDFGEDSFPFITGRDILQRLVSKYLFEPLTLEADVSGLHIILLKHPMHRDEEEEEEDDDDDKENEDKVKVNKEDARPHKLLPINRKLVDIYSEYPEKTRWVKLYANDDDNEVVIKLRFYAYQSSSSSSYYSSSYTESSEES